MTIKTSIRVATVIAFFLPCDLTAQQKCKPKLSELVGSIRGLDLSRLREFRQRAKSGDTDAQMTVGAAYEYGPDGTRNIAEAARFYEMAAKAGKSAAQAQLAYVEYFYKNSPAAAAQWNSKASEQGCVDAQLALADAYMNGDGVQKDVSEGLKLLHQSAESGYAVAQANLGDMLLYDKRIEHDPGEALKWYAQASEQGSNRGQYGAGLIYSFGRQLKPPYAEDHVAGYMWLSIALANGKSSARLSMDQIGAKMTKEEIAEANRRKESWIAAHQALMNQEESP
jgi:TPR repeat protein